MGFKNTIMKIKNIQIWLIHHKILCLVVVFPLSFTILKLLSWLFNRENFIYSIISLVILLIVLITLHFITNKTKKKISQLSDASNSSYISADVPISTEKEDVLNRKYFVENLKDIILDYPLDEQSIRICIDAQWGYGKTSLFNLLKEKLERKKDIVAYINFNPWYYNNEESALKGLLKLLSNTISNQDPYPSTNDDTDELIKTIVGGVCNKFLGITFEILFEKDKNIQKSLKSISESVKKTGKKYVIFIDDLDRLDGSAIKNILKVIMILSEIRGLIFVIAASTEHICANKDKEISKKYIEKIMTVILPIPRINHAQIKEYFYKEFYEIIKGENFSLKEKEEIEARIKTNNFLSLKNLCNLRNIKRLLGTFELLYKPLAIEINVVDFIFIVYLYIFFPEMVAEIYDNKHQYICKDTDERIDINPKEDCESIAKEFTDKLYWGTFGNNSGIYFEKLKQHINSSYQQDDKEALQFILSVLFSKVKSIYPEVNSKYCKRLKSIEDSFYFPKYFRFFVDKNDISDKLLEENICKWKESPPRLMIYANLLNAVRTTILLLFSLKN